MNACTIQRGIFSLRTCGNPSTDNCAHCMQPICLEHAHYGREQILCPKCFVASPDSSADDGPDMDGSEWETPGWSSRWSSDYRDSHSYVPLAAGNQHGRFDDFDRNAFATRSDGVTDDGEGDGPAGFSDS